MNIITKTRINKHVTIKDISKYLELPVLVYMYYEFTGITQMHCDTLFDLCDFLEIDYSVL